MRTLRSLSRRLVPTLLVLAGACEGGESPLEPSLPPDAAPAAPAAGQADALEPAGLAAAHWADAYVLADSPTASAYTPSSTGSYNRSGGAIRIQRVSGYTGRYIVTFTGLSALLGTKSTVHVTAKDLAFPTRCAPVNGHLVTDKVEVRCNLYNGQAVNAEFSLVVLGKTTERAFAFGHLPTGPSYAPKGAGSWNPAGASRVVRHDVGLYEVTFTGFGTKMPSRHVGQVQVGAVGTGKQYCKLLEEWGGSPDLKVRVQCLNVRGAPVDAKFTVLVHAPISHLGYTFVSQPGSSSTGDPYYTWNPNGFGTTINRIEQGNYIVSWSNAAAQFLGTATAHATAVGIYDNAACMVAEVSGAAVRVICFAANGVLVDVPFTVMIGT